MYRTCLFCTASLGANDVLEEFPVGGTVAFDAWRGRLWAVCPRCARWNLAPIEERWEAVEAADRLFTDTRVRVQSENVGLAKLRDGTRLIRIGQALPGELAAWRYGSQLVDRRRRYLLGTAAAGTAAAVVVLGGPALLAAGVGLGGLGGLFNVGSLLYQQRRARQVVHRFDAGAGEPPLALRRWNLTGARLEADAEGEPLLRLPHGLDIPGPGRWRAGTDSAPLVLRGPAARTVMGRALVEANASGASRRHLDGAVELLALAGSAEEFLRSQAWAGVPLGVRNVPAPHRRIRAGKHVPSARPSRPQGLALEMALHEESERRAMEGELSALEAAWREAEEIAAIADALPDNLPEDRSEDPLDRLRLPERDGTP